MAIGAGWLNTIAVKADGHVAIWGQYFRQNSSLEDCESYLPSSATNIVAATGGRSHTVALTADGHVLCWGIDCYGDTVVPANLCNVVAIAATEWATLAVRADGTVTKWGSGDQLILPANIADAV